MQRNARYRWLLAIVLCTLTGIALASSAREVRKQVEASRLITGTIDFDEQGRVVRQDFKDVQSLGRTGSAWLQSHVAQWQFEPVIIDGQPRQARTHARVLLVAKQMPDNKVSLRVASADFSGDPASTPKKSEEDVRSKRLRPPAFPPDLARGGVSGTVYVVLRIGRDGRVADAASERVNLRVLASEAEMERIREKLARTTLDAVRRWTFIPPTKGVEADNDFWHVRVPVDFVGPGAKNPKDNEWTAYIPGPRAVIPWMNYEGVLPPDALAGGGIYPVRKGGIRLMTELD